MDVKGHKPFKLMTSLMMEMTVIDMPLYLKRRIKKQGKQEEENW